MMGLPDGWTRVDGVSRAQRIAICGRAVVPPPGRRRLPGAPRPHHHNTEGRRMMYDPRYVAPSGAPTPIYRLRLRIAALLDPPTLAAIARTNAVDVLDTLLPATATNQACAHLDAYQRGTVTRRHAIRHALNGMVLPEVE